MEKSGAFQYSLPLSFFVHGQQDDLEETTIRGMEYIRLHAAIDLLPEVQRRRVHLYFFEEYTYEEIAVMEGCTKRAVKFSVDPALQKLKEKL